MAGPPEFKCPCGRVLVPRTSSTNKNPGRKFLSCNTCDTWIWEDILKRYVEEVVFSSHPSAITTLQAQVQLLRNQIYLKEVQISSLMSYLENSKDDSRDRALMPDKDQMHVLTHDHPTSSETKTWASPPKLRCGCGCSVQLYSDSSNQAVGHRFFQCKVCYLLVWERELNRYVDEMVSYCHSATIDSLQAHIEACQSSIIEKDLQIRNLKGGNG